MAIDDLYLSLIVQTVEQIRHPDPGKQIDCLELGYPDLLVNADEVDQICGAQTSRTLPLRDDSDAISRWHGYKSQYGIFETHALWKSIGIRPTTIDFTEVRGGERMVDLNYPLPVDLVEAYDLIIDTGTLEHCFNVGQAFINMCSALRDNGVAIHAAPLNRYNHGFWSFNPTLYYDFCDHNGMSVQWMRGVTRKREVIELPEFAGFKTDLEGVAIIAILRRDKVQELSFPVQRKYR